MPLRVVQELSDVLLGFIDGDEAGVLVLTLSDPEVAIPVRLLSDLAAVSAADRWVVSAEAVAGAGEWGQALAVAAGFPDMEPGMALGGRLRAIIAAAAKEVPTGGRLVLAALPIHQGEEAAIGAALAELVSEGLEPRLRLVIRSLPGGALDSWAEGWPDLRVMAFAPGLTTEALMAALAAGAVDPTWSPSERRRALLQVGWHALGAGRLAEAEASFSRLAEAFAAAEEPDGEAQALAGVGEARRRAGDLAGARQAEERALGLAASVGDRLLSLQLVRHLADAYEAEGRIEEAMKGHKLAESLALEVGIDPWCAEARHHRERLAAQLVAA